MQIDQTATGSVQIIVEELIENKSNQKLLTPKCIGVGALPLLYVWSALCRSGREEPKRKCEVGDMFDEMEGYIWVVIETDGVVEVKYQMMDTEEEEGGLDSNDEGEVGSEEEVVQLIMETEGSVPDVVSDKHTN
jgi:hypothetical protein